MNRQRGAALLMVLLILAIMAALAAKMTLQFQSTWQTQMFLLNQQQLQWLAHDAEQIAIQKLRRDLKDTPQNNNLNQSWAQTGETDNEDGPAVTYVIVDGQACFNINSLQQNQPDSVTKEEPYNTRVLRQLLIDAGSNRAETERFVDSLSDYLDIDDQVRSAGAESKEYKKQATSGSAVKHEIYSLNELALLPDFPRKIVAQIRNQLCVLPEETQQINVNTLAEAQAPLLSAMFLGEITTDDAKKILTARPLNGWNSVDLFLQEVKKQRFTIAPDFAAIKPLLTVRSRFFTLYSQGSTGDQKNTMSSSLFFNKDDSSIKIYQRRYRILE